MGAMLRSPSCPLSAGQRLLRRVEPDAHVREVVSVGVVVADGRPDECQQLRGPYERGHVLVFRRQSLEVVHQAAALAFVEFGPGLAQETGVSRVALLPGTAVG